MKLSTAVLAATCVAAKAGATSAVDGDTCSSLNGPFCAAFGSGFTVAPLHARESLGVSDEKMKAIEVAKSLKIEKVLKQYERQETTSDADGLELEVEVEDIIESIKNLLNDKMTIQSEVESDKINPMAGMFSFSNENGVFELLDKMNGDELKMFFETALDEVLLSVIAPLQELSSGETEGLRTTARELKALEDYETYVFQLLDESQLASIRHKFAAHRLVELQQSFEQLVIAENAHDRQLALETAIFLFQLAQEEAREPESIKQED